MSSAPHNRDLTQEVLTLLQKEQIPLTREAIRSSLKVKNTTLGQALISLHHNGRIQRSHKGWGLVPITPSHATQEGNKHDP
ncbi:hypothetical protein ACFL27_28255 [candidate division CSSED10-310 bacterium]|uniref:Transcriptional regulator n=1 Tax=candidate division CSSED10-310 bacterium TaxID=2855610 RepID=A0ABV6Z6M9_UNCC1